MVAALTNLTTVRGKNDSRLLYAESGRNNHREDKTNGEVFCENW